MNENKTNGQIRVPIKNTTESYLVGIAGVALLLQQIKHIEDEDLRTHLVESAQELCHNLIEEGQE